MTFGAGQNLSGDGVRLDIDFVKISVEEIPGTEHEEVCIENLNQQLGREVGHGGLSDFLLS